MTDTKEKKVKENLRAWGAMIANFYICKNTEFSQRQKQVDAPLPSVCGRQSIIFISCNYEFI
jgi:hypothetical protein